MRLRDRRSELSENGAGEHGGYKEVMGLLNGHVRCKLCIHLNTKVHYMHVAFWDYG